MTDVASDRERLLISGWSTSRVGGGALNQPLIVAGSPGDAWQVIDHLPLPAGTGGRLTSVAVGGSLTLAGGSLSDGTAVVWTSASEGVDWEGPVGVPADKGSSVASLVFDTTEFVAVGEMVGFHTGAATWRSSDGVTWSADPALPGSFAAATLFAGRVVAVGHDATSAIIYRLSGGREGLPAPEGPI